MLLVITVVSFMTMIWILETMCRAEAIVQLDEAQDDRALDDEAAAPPAAVGFWAKARALGVFLLTPTGCTGVTERSVVRPLARRWERGFHHG